MSIERKIAELLAESKAAELAEDEYEEDLDVVEEGIASNRVTQGSSAQEPSHLTGSYDGENDDNDRNNRSEERRVGKECRL